MEKSGWRYVMTVLLLVLFLAAVIFYIRELEMGEAVKGATLVYELPVKRICT